MNINDTIYIITPVELHGRIIPNSAQMLKAKVIEILQGKLIVEIELGEGRIEVRTIIEPYYKTVHEALPALEMLMNPKIKPVKEEDYKGEDLPGASSIGLLTSHDK